MLSIYFVVSGKKIKKKKIIELPGLLSSTVVINKLNIKSWGFSLPYDPLVKVRNKARNNLAIETLPLAFRQL